MFKIRALQMNALSVDAVKDFEARMLVHLMEFFPAEYTQLGEEKVRAMVRYGIERAATYGIRSERGVCSYVDVMFAYGCEFDRDMSLSWAQSILLESEPRDEVDRANRLFDDAFGVKRHKNDTADDLADDKNFYGIEVVP